MICKEYMNKCITNYQLQYCLGEKMKFMEYEFEAIWDWVGYRVLGQSSIHALNHFSILAFIHFSIIALLKKPKPTD